MALKTILIFIISFNLYATPAHVIIIRHGEKAENSNELSPFGFARANALVGLFVNSPISQKYGIPQYIFCTEPEDSEGSIRSIQTAVPLAKYLNLPINHNFKKDEYASLTYEILNNPIYNGKTILIVWAHKRIVEMASSLGAYNVPTKWSDKNFDRLWIVNYYNNAFLNFDNLPQHLLYGDTQI